MRFSKCLDDGQTFSVLFDCFWGRKICGKSRINCAGQSCEISYPDAVGEVGKFRGWNVYATYEALLDNNNKEEESNSNQGKIDSTAKWNKSKANRKKRRREVMVWCVSHSCKEREVVEGRTEEEQRDP